MDATWQRCLDAYLQTVLDRSGSVATHTNYAAILKQFFTMHVCPGEVTKTDVEAFVQLPKQWPPREAGKPCSVSTKNGRIAVLTSLYRYASTYIVDGVPLYRRALPTTGIAYLKPKREYRGMSADELERFFKSFDRSTALGKRDFALFWLYFITARRRNEIVRLTWSSIEQATIIDSAGNRSGFLYRYQSKGHSREIVTAELPASAYAYLIDYLVASGRLPLMKPDSPLFVANGTPDSGQRGRKPTTPYLGNGGLDDEHINYRFKLALKRAGITRSLSLHALRHASALERYRAGEGVLEIQKVLGHSNLGVTQNYLMFMSGISDSGAKKLEERFGRL